jgi:cytochrome oxidase Cu insertion factor (SCO1/SenC/PrrC family)
MDSLVTRRALQVFTGILVGMAVVSVFLVVAPPWTATPEENLLADPLVPEPFPAPDFTLQTPDGQPFTQDDLKGQVSVVFFGFASCPDICPVTLATFSRALEILESAETSFQGIFVSVDPGRDTPEVLSSYMDRFHPTLTALTGPEAEVHRVAESWGIHVAFLGADQVGSDPHAHHGSDHPEDSRTQHEGPEREDDSLGMTGADHGGEHPTDDLPFPEETDTYHVEHSTRSLVVDRDGQIVGTLAPYLTAQEVIETLQPLLAP